MIQRFKDMITDDFLKAFRFELCRIYNIDLNAFEDDIDFIMSSSFSTALGMACMKTGNDKLFKNYQEIDDYDVDDHFRINLVKLLTEKKLLLSGSQKEFISKQLNISSDDITQCARCKKYFLKDTLLPHYHNEEKKGEPHCYLCGGCTDSINNLETHKPIRGSMMEMVSSYYYEAEKIVDEYYEELIYPNRDKTDYLEIDGKKIID